MRYILVIVTLLTTEMLSADSPTRVVIYDAKEKKFTKWVEEEQSVREDHSSHYDASDLVVLKVKNAKCGVRFRVARTEIPIAELGADARGLEQAEGLVQGALPPPPAAGIEALPGVIIREHTLSETLSRLRVWEGAGELKLELKQEWQILQEALDALKQRETDYRAALCQLTALTSQGISCPMYTGTRAIDEVDKELKALASQVAEPQRGCDRFSQIVRDTNSSLRRVKDLRAQIAGPPIGSSAPELERDLRALHIRTNRFHEKLALVLEGVKIAELLLSDEPASGPTLAYFDRLTMLKERYGEGVDEADLQELALAYRQYRHEREKKQIQEELIEIRQWILSLVGTPGTGSVPQANSVISSYRLQIDATIKSVAADRNAFVHTVTSFNRELKKYFERLDTLYAATTRGELEVGPPMGPFPTNHIIVIEMYQQETYQKPDLEGLNEIELPAGAIVREAESPEPDEDKYDLATASRLEFHKTYRFNVGGAFAFSNLEETQYVIRQVARLDENGLPMVDDDGNAVNDSKLFIAGSDEQLDLALTFGIYAKRIDVFPGSSGLQFGGIFGVSFKDPTDNFYLGAMLQPTVGLQLLIGGHYGRVTVPEGGIEVGVTVLPPGSTEPPVREARKWDLFYGINVDINLFRRLFASQP